MMQKYNKTLENKKVYAVYNKHEFDISMKLMGNLLFFNVMLLSNSRYKTLVISGYGIAPERISGK